MQKATWVAGGLGVLWVVLAFISPTTTYHLAPLLVAGALPGFTLWELGSVGPSLRLLLGGAGIAWGLLVTLALSAAGKLTGPSLLPSGGAVLEAVVFAIVGAALGALVFRIREPARS